MSGDNDISKLKEILLLYSTEQFATFVPRSMLGLSESEMQTVQFAFWFCHIIERDLRDALMEAISKARAILGDTSSEVDSLLRNQYGIKFEKVDVDHPKYDPDSITFNDRIDIVEKIRGTDAHTDFLRKIKKIRNDLSHGRIGELSYNGEPLFKDSTKAELVLEYVIGCSNFTAEGKGGAVSLLTPNQRDRINALWDEYNKRIAPPPTDRK